MNGITAHAVRIPAYRIAREEIAHAWQASAHLGYKRAIRFDEDSLTLAAAAAYNCLASRNGQPASLLFASTTAPFLERQNASLIAAACDLDASAFTADFASSLRAATTALHLALASDKPTLLCAADVRDAEPGSPEEMLYSDAGAAVATGTNNVIAELLASSTTYDDFLDTVRRDRDLTVTSYASKFTSDRGYIAPIIKVANQALKQAGKSAKDLAKLIVTSPDRRTHLQLAKKLGVAETQIQDLGFNDGGLSGAAMPLVLLSAALETAKPGDLLLLAAHGSGADAFLFRVTDQISNYRPHSPIAAQLSSPLDYGSYTQYRKARGFFRTADQGLEISNVFYAKEEPQAIRLHGSECGHCGTRQFPVAQVCVGCNKSDALHDVTLSRTGKVFTFAIDTLYASPFPPTLMAVVDLDGGGRIYCEVVDLAPADLKIGLPVELTLRKLKEGGGLYHYYWKCIPRRTA